MRIESASLLVARVLLGLVFLLAGIGKLGNPDGFIAGLEGVPAAPLAGWIAILTEIVAPIVLVVGWQARWAALALFVFTLAASVIGHAFWAHEGAEAARHQGQFLKNLAIAGGMLAIAAKGEIGTLRDLMRRGVPAVG